MKLKQFLCKNCGNRFEIEVFEKGEAEAKRLPVGKIHCPKCNRTDIDEDS